MINARCLMLMLALAGGFALSPADAAVVWNGPTMTFTRAAFADYTLPENQDRIATGVWLTRASTQGLFNVAQEAAYATNVSPNGTEWAYGTTANYSSLIYKDWQTFNGNSPPSMVGKDAVLHLIAADAYVDIKFLTWSTSAVGSGYSYARSTDNPEPSGLVVLVVAGALMRLRRPRRSR